MLENAVERWAGKMEEDWLWCGADEDAVSLSVVDSIFEDLIADSTIALLDGDSQRQVPSLSAYLSQCPCLYLFVAALLRPCVCVCLPSCCLRVCASVFAGSVDPSCARLPNVIDWTVTLHAARQVARLERLGEEDYYGLQPDELIEGGTAGGGRGNGLFFEWWKRDTQLQAHSILKNE